MTRIGLLNDRDPVHGRRPHLDGRVRHDLGRDQSGRDPTNRLS